MVPHETDHFSDAFAENLRVGDLIVVTLEVGRPILVPIVASVVVTLILIRAADQMARVPVLGRLPEAVRRVLVLVVAGACALLLGLIVADMVDRIALQLPVYEENIEALIATTAARFGLARSTAPLSAAHFTAPRDEDRQQQLF